MAVGKGEATETHGTREGVGMAVVGHPAQRDRDQDNASHDVGWRVAHVESDDGNMKPAFDGGGNDVGHSSNTVHERQSMLSGWRRHDNRRSKRAGTRARRGPATKYRQGKARRDESRRQPTAEMSRGSERSQKKKKRRFRERRNNLLRRQASLYGNTRQRRHIEG